MGRLTHVSIGKALPDRTSIVLTREPTINQQNTFWHLDDTALLWANNRETALYFADVITIQKNQTEFFVIGGSYMFDMFEDLFNRVYLTEVFSDKIPNADAFFDFKFDGRQWEKVEEENVPAGPHDQFPTRYTVLDRKFKKVRYVEVEDYFTDDQAKKKWLSEQVALLNNSPKNRNSPPRLQYKMFSED